MCMWGGAFFDFYTLRKFNFDKGLRYKKRHRFSPLLAVNRVFLIVIDHQPFVI